ncbi:MAG: hypothetical protein JNN20_08185, partial [Betaproteobacteria bacterium]|nr:hypothetical protein [Betaproteobacteria bacterium]
MKKTLLIIVALLSISIGGYLWFTRAQPDSAKSAAAKSQPAVNPASGKLSDSWRKGTLIAADSARMPRPHETPLHRQFVDSKDFYALYRSLDGRTDGDALFFRASLLERCKGYDSTFTGPSKIERAKAYVASLTGAFRELRRDIYLELAERKTGTDSCHRFAGPITQAQIEEAYREAAEAGDPRGKLVQLHRALVRRAGASDPAEMIDSPFPSVTILTSDQLTEAEAALLKSALASQDPAQILVAGPLLMAMYKNYELKFGDGEGLRGINHYSLWKSVACHYAGGCGI